MTTMTNEVDIMNTQTKGQKMTAAMDSNLTIEQIKFEMKRANKCYDSCVKLGLADSADQYHAEYVELRTKLEGLNAG